MPLTHEKRLERFIRQQAFGEHDEKLVKFVFYHSPPGRKPKLIWEHKVGGDGITEDDLGPLVESFMETLKEDANGMGGLQKYTIEAERDGGMTSGRYSAKIFGEGEEDEGLAEYDGDPLGHEGATARGIVNQSMRHNEALTKTFMGMIGAILSHSQRTVMSQSEMIDKLLTEKWANAQAMEEAYSKRHEREMQAMVISAEQDRKDKISELLLMLAPAAVNRLGGKKMLPEAATPREEMLKRVIHSLDASQFEAIMSNLKPEQAIVLGELIMAFRAEEEAKQSKEKNGSG